MNNIIVIGGGISGLTVAHELINLGYDVMLIERNEIIGGLARTLGSKTPKICFSEHSWRAFGRWYQNVYNIMKSIPFDKNKTVYDTLTELQGGKKTCNKKIPNYENTFTTMPYGDMMKMMPIFTQYMMSCDERNIKNYGSINLKKFIKANGLSSQGENLIGKIVGPYLGFDYHNASVYDLLYGFEMMYINSDPNNKFNITSLPTNMAWFNPWLDFMKSKGLKIRLNTQTVELKLNDSNEIESILTYDKVNKSYERMSAKYYVNCTGPEILEELLRPYDLRKEIKLFYDNIKNVAKNGRQIQLSVYYYVDKKMFLDNENTLAYLPNTSWILMILPTGHVWSNNGIDLGEYCDKNIKEIVSVGICEPFESGILIKKPWSECTREEIEIEAWHQLSTDEHFKANICVEDNTKIEDVKIIDFKMWDSYVYKDGKIDTYEPKWANNVDTRKHRPNAVTPIKNMFLGGAYTNSSTSIYSMEGAVESGKKAAIALCEQDNKKQDIYLHNKEKFMLTKPIRHVDNLLFTFGLNYVILVLIVIFIILVFNT